jgi:hypothetical protein
MASRSAAEQSRVDAQDSVAARRQNWVAGMSHDLGPSFSQSILSWYLKKLYYLFKISFIFKKGKIF